MLELDLLQAQVRTKGPSCSLSTLSSTLWLRWSLYGEARLLDLRERWFWNDLGAFAKINSFA